VPHCAKKSFQKELIAGMRVKQLFLLHTVITTIIIAALLVWEFWSILLIQIFDLLLREPNQEHLISFAT